MTIPSAAPSKVALPSLNNWVTLTTSPLTSPARFHSRLNVQADDRPPVHCINHSKTRLRPDRNAIRRTSQYAKSGGPSSNLGLNNVGLCKNINCNDTLSEQYVHIMSQLDPSQSLSEHDTANHYSVWAIGMVIKLFMYKYTNAGPGDCAVCGRSPAEIVGSNPTGGMDVCLLWVLRAVR